MTLLVKCSSNSTVGRTYSKNDENDGNASASDRSDGYDGDHIYGTIRNASTFRTCTKDMRGMCKTTSPYSIYEDSYANSSLRRNTFRPPRLHPRTLLEEESEIKNQFSINRETIFRAKNRIIETFF